MNLVKSDKILKGLSTIRIAFWDEYFTEVNVSQGHVVC